MSDLKDGGPAFPVSPDESRGHVSSVHGGMTLRDKFADSVLNGLCANPGGPFQQCDQSGWRLVNCTFDDIAKSCYELADAMLRAREVSNG
jgi:hypothetical protein